MLKMPALKGFSKVAETQPEPSQTTRDCSPLSRSPPSSFWFVGKLNFFLLAVFKPTEKACGASHLAVYAGLLPSENRYVMILNWIYENFKKNLRWCCLFLLVEQATGASPIQIWENMRVNKTLILNSSVAIIELPYEPKRKNVHPPMMWLFTAHCSLMSWKPCCWSKTNKCLTTCPHFYNLSILLQLVVHTSTLQLTQLLVTKTMGNGQYWSLTNNFCLNSAVC